MMPHDLPPWPWSTSRRAAGWPPAGFEAIVHDLRILLRRAAERPAPPSAAILDARTIQSTPESGARAGYDGHKRRKGSKVHVAVDTLGHLLALLVTPANEQERAQVEELASAVQQVTGESRRAGVRRSGLHRRAEPAAAAAAHGIQLEVVKLPEAKRGFVLLPRRWVVERELRLGSAFPPPGARLRAPGGDLGGPAFPGLRLSPAPSLHPLTLSP